MRACTCDFSGSLLWMLTIDNWQFHERNTSRYPGELNNQRFYFAIFRDKVKGVTASSKVCICTCRCRGSQLAIGCWAMVIFCNFVIVQFCFLFFSNFFDWAMLSSDKFDHLSPGTSADPLCLQSPRLCWGGCFIFENCCCYFATTRLLPSQSWMRQKVRSTWFQKNIWGNFQASTNPYRQTCRRPTPKGKF